MPPAGVAAVGTGVQAAHAGYDPTDLPLVSVIVLNYNGRRHLDTCFRSLLALDYPTDRTELILVDNASSDDSLEFMRRQFPTVRLIETGANLGFAAGNNYGAERANGAYIAFLNNDTRVEPDWLREMVKSVESDPAPGTVCTSSLMLDWDGEKIDFQAGALNFHGFGFQPSYGQPRSAVKIEPRELLFACGGSMLINRQVFLEVGGFDPDYFAFFEDVDLGWRLWVLGFRVTLTPTAITYHRHHGTAGGIPPHRTQVLFERNALYTIFKNYEEENLSRILPAALLLLGQRAARFMELGGVDFERYSMTGLPDTAANYENVHREAVAGLLAADEFRANLEKFQEKRAWLQANRKRADSELFALFGQPGRVHLLNHSSDTPYASAHFASLSEFGIGDLWRELPRDVLVISPDVLPVGDIPASGSGIRAWALGQGLAAKGHRVTYTMPLAAVAGREGSVPPEFVRGAWTPETLQSIVDALHPDVVVSCGWPNLTWLPRANVPVALDLAGPHLLERAYQQYLTVDRNAQEKLAAIARADYFTCISERQRHYFMGWLAQAGVPVERLADLISVVPYSLSPQQPEHRWPDGWDDEEVRFIYGGIFLPWQNPAAALLCVASTLEEQGKGVLEVIGGKHPFHAVDTGSFGPLVNRLSAMPRVRMSGLLPHDELVERYRAAHVAVDVMLPNAERELAFPSRTVHYMWCGLPVIHPAHSEAAPLIREWEAGWVVEAGDETALREVVIGLLANPSEARRRGENAQRLVRDKLSWDGTSESLDKFARSPHFRSERATRTQHPQDGQLQAVRSIIPSEVRLGAGAAQPSLPTGLRREAQKRRTLPRQVTSRTRELIRTLAPAMEIRNGKKGVGALPELIAGHSLGQRFRCPLNGLSGVRVRVNTMGRRNTCSLVLHLRTNPAASQDLFSRVLPAYGLKNGQEVALRFPPLEDSQGKWFYLVVESPDGAPGDAVSLVGTRAHGHGDGDGGQRYEDGLPMPGSVMMTLEFNGQGAGA